MVFPMLDHCQYCNTISKGEFHALKDQGIIGAGIILFKFTYEFCSVSVYLQLLGFWQYTVYWPVLLKVMGQTLSSGLPI